jgi:hypothetical protein
MAKIAEIEARESIRPLACLQGKHHAEKHKRAETSPALQNSLQKLI